MAGKQVDATRHELFITLKYLLDNCYDEKHTSKTVDLMDYAKENYNALLDRRRVNSILEFLSELPQTFPGILPFTIRKVNNKPRYYIEYSLLNEKEVKSIAEAISSYEDITETMSEKLIQKFLDNVCNQELKNKIVASLQRSKSRSKHKNFQTVEKFLSIEELIENQYRFLFRPKKQIGYSACSNAKVFDEINNLLSDKDKYISTVGYVRAKGKDVCLYFPGINGAAILDVDNIIIKKYSINRRRLEPLSFELEDSKYEDIDAMIDSYYKGQTGVQFLIKFKYVVGTQNNINEALVDRLKNDYEEYFSEPMNCELIEREEIVDTDDGEQETLVYVDAHGSVRCNFTSFKNWYWEHGWYKHLVVVSPASFNNRLLSPYIELFRRRVEKYGRKPLTPEEIEERNRRREERKAKQAERAAQQADSSNNDGGN